MRVPKCAELLDEAGLNVVGLEAPDARLPLSVVAELTERARRLTGEPGLGFYLGIQKRASVYGHHGLAMASAATLREALELAVQFSKVITTSLEVRLKIEGRSASLILEERADRGRARDVSLISLVVGLKQIGKALTGRDLRGTVDISMPEPFYFQRFSHLSAKVRWDQPVTQIVFDAELLDLRLVVPDRVALLLAREQCERELRALGFDGALVARARRSTFPEWLRIISRITYIPILPKAELLTVRREQMKSPPNTERKQNDVVVARLLPVIGSIRRAFVRQLSSFERR